MINCSPFAPTKRLVWISLEKSPRVTRHVTVKAPQQITPLKLQLLSESQGRHQGTASAPSATQVATCHGALGSGMWTSNWTE
jgi:hypothetical protein